MTTQHNVLEVLTHTVGNCIREANRAGLTETTALLRIVELDLITRLNGISEEELETLQFVLESELRISEHMKPPQMAGRTAAKPRSSERGL